MSKHYSTAFTSPAWQLSVNDAILFSEKKKQNKKTKHFRRKWIKLNELIKEKRRKKH